MPRPRLAPIALLPALLLPTLLAGCGGGLDTENILKISGLLFLTGIIGKRSAATPIDAAPLGRAEIRSQGGRGTATLHLTPPVGTEFPTADVAVAGSVGADGTLDLRGTLADGTPVRVAGRNGQSIYLTIGTKTTEHTSPSE